MEPNEHHNRGQSDGGANNFDPPHEKGVAELAIPYTDQELADRASYREGWKHGYDQR